jgi:phosphoribosyl 1,2-cyclic phosphate phosphodiesterase
LEWIVRIQPRRAILTHMHVPLDYATVMRETPENVEPGYDGMTVEILFDSK